MSESPLLFERRGSVAVLTLNRPEVHNAQNSAMLYALDEAFARFAGDDELAVAVLRGAGKSFSSGHDLGSDGADYDLSFDRRTMWWDHVGKVAGENWLARESEVYLGFCRRWRELPKPTIAMVHGACIAGGLMLAWSCDLIIASDDAFFADPVVRMGVPGVELFAHPWVMGPRRAKEFLFLGDRVGAERAYEIGMVNRVVARDALEAETMAIAERIAERPRFGLATAKMAVNQAEDAMGYRTGIDAAFSLHQLAHLQAQVETGSPIRGLDAGTTRAAMGGPANGEWADR
jgi:enoyl-CoA hydratase/carnithine racemase